MHVIEFSTTKLMNVSRIKVLPHELLLLYYRDTVAYRCANDVQCRTRSKREGCKSKVVGLGRRSNHKHNRRLLEMPRRSLPSRKSRRVEAAVKILGLFGHAKLARAALRENENEAPSARFRRKFLHSSWTFLTIHPSKHRPRGTTQERRVLERSRIFMSRIFVCLSSVHEYVNCR